MRHHVLPLAVLVPLLLLLSSSPAAATPALERPVPGDVLLGFGVPYASRVHHGLDLAADAGRQVLAPAEGAVTFAGRLPFEGGEALAVTVTTAAGLKVTCLPLASLDVARGETVRAGAPLGEVAAEGDPSSAAAHVHLSVRDGEAYLDPAPLLPQAEAGPAGEPEGAGAGDTAPSPSPAAAPAPATAPAPAMSAAPALSAAPAPRAAGSPAAAPAPAGSAAPAASARMGTGSVQAPAVAPLSSAVQAGLAVPRVSRALGRHAPRPARPASPVPPLSARGVAAAFSRLRSFATGLAALIVAAVLLWPAWRRTTATAPLAEPAPVRVRT